ncbi:MAG: RDD family protein [Arcobacteraceae bacterium]|nr:RDD family protein [Arcobacteraceae bacterium]
MNDENQNVNIDNLELATQRSRVGAFIIDDLLITFITILMLWEHILTVNGDFMSILMIMNDAFIQILVLKFIYQTFFIWYYGATVGKIIVKIKVIDFNNFGKVSLSSALIRAGMRIVSETIFYIGFIISYYTDSRQTLHDKTAHTLVVNV